MESEASEVLMDEFLDSVSYVGEVRDWLDVPETDTSEDEPDYVDDNPTAPPTRSLGGPGSGNFGHAGRPGEVGGSDASGGAGEAKKGPNKLTKENVAKIYELHKQGAKAKDIAAQFKIPHVQYVHQLVAKAKAKEASVKQILGTPVATPATPATQTGDVPDWYKFEQQKSGPGTFAAPTAPSGIVTPSGYSTTEGSAAFHVPNPEGLILSKGEDFQSSSYLWQEKTTGPQAGKFAYFQNGAQVSSAFAKADFEKAIPTIHQGKGPGGQATKAGDTSPHDFKADHFPGVGKVDDWPISDDVVRAAGSTTPTQLQTIGHQWEAKLSTYERAAVKSYTGSAYTNVNNSLRQNPNDLGVSAKRIQDAIDKHPSPPPPELVWRGMAGSDVQKFVKGLASGDVIQLRGFQSTSIDPHSSWSGVKFEIRPAKGAYVHVISGHKSEYEYLLPHNAKYTVRGMTTVKFKGGTSHNVIQLDMHK